MNQEYFILCVVDGVQFSPRIPDIDPVTCHLSSSLCDTLILCLVIMLTFVGNKCKLYRPFHHHITVKTLILNLITLNKINYTSSISVKFLLMNSHLAHCQTGLQCNQIYIYIYILDRRVSINKFRPNHMINFKIVSRYSSKILCLVLK